MSELSPLQQVVNMIQRSENILLLTHAHADGDGLSSILALANAIGKLGKHVTPATADKPGFMYQFLPNIDSIENNIAGASDLALTIPLDDRDAEISHKIEDGQLKIFIRSNGEPFMAEQVAFGAGESNYDLVITCDTPELPMLGSLFEVNPDLFYETAVVNVDHHASNTAYGKVNLIDVTAASTTEILLRVIQNLETESNKKLIDDDVATLLLTGLITDTGSFQHANTTPRALEVAADLIELGGRQQEIINHIFKTKQLATLKLWGRVLSKIEYDPLHRIVWSTVTSTDLAEADGTDADVGDVIDEVMTNAPGAEVVLLLKQNGVGATGSLRTTTPSCNAIEISGMFGGGGHVQAAGFKVPGKTVEEALPEVIQRIQAYQAKRLNILPPDESNTSTAAVELPDATGGMLEDIATKIAAASSAEDAKKKAAKKPPVEKAKTAAKKKKV